MAKIYVSPSTQTSNAYAGTHPGLAEDRDDEQYWQQKVRDVVVRHLEAAGHQTRTHDYTDVLSTQMAEANEWGADLYVALHSNATGLQGSTRRGCEVYHYPGSEAGRAFAETVYRRLEALTPVGDRGVLSANFAEVRVPNAPAILIEIDYHDAFDGAAWIRSNVEQIGAAIAQGIIDHIAKKDATMPIAENGWPCIPLSSTTTFLAPNGKVVYVNPAAREILGYVAWRWHMSVEPIAAATNLEGDPAVRQGAIVAIHSWRDAARIAESDYYSNHGTGLAMDVNGHLHPYEFTELQKGRKWYSGFTAEQVAALRKIQAEIRALAGGVNILRLGLDFTVGRRDGMHVELWATAAQLARCAAAIRATGWLVPARRGDISSYQAAIGVKADDFHGVNTTRVLKLEQAKLGVEPTGRWDVATRTAWCQTRLTAHGFDPGVVDGLPGPLFDAAVKRFQKAKGLEVDGIPGRLTVAALAKAPVVVAPKPAPTPAPEPAPVVDPDLIDPPGRLSRDDRYAGAAAAYLQAEAGVAKKVYLFAGEGWADAIAAPPDGCVLLLRPGSDALPTAVARALRQRRPTQVLTLVSTDLIPPRAVHAARRAAGIA